MSKCKPCLGEDIKELVRQHSTDPDTLMKLNTIPDCEYADAVEVCGSTRKASAYQAHTSECMKSGKSMKECAALWKKKKGGS